MKAGTKHGIIALALAIGGGVLWFSPFGPLQVVLGFPLDPLEVEKSPVFEFSVGGAGL